MHQRPDDFQVRQLSPAMASLRLLVLDFVRDYIGRWDGSPSLGEIGNALRIDRKRVQRAIRSLAADGLILRTPGPRGLALPGAEAEALRQLLAMGWTVNGQRADVTKTGLLPPAALDYPGSDDEEGLADDGTQITRAKGSRSRG